MSPLEINGSVNLIGYGLAAIGSGIGVGLIFAAVIQGTALGLTAIFHVIDLVQSDLDTVVNKLLVAEAKAMGGNRIQLLGAGTTPRHGIFALSGTIIGFPISQATGVAVK